MNTKYTPGPWTARGAEIFDGLNECPIAKAFHIFYRRGDQPQISADANAQLIAAAPALLEACKAAISWLEVIPIEYRNRPHYPIAQLQQAIQLAESTDKVTI